jgi:hypothetical protein
MNGVSLGEIPAPWHLLPIAASDVAAECPQRTEADRRTTPSVARGVPGRDETPRPRVRYVWSSASA